MESVAYQELGGAKDGYFARKIYIPVDDTYYENVNKHVNKYRTTDCYTSVYIYDTTEIDKAMMYGPVYLDLDGKLDTDEDFNALKRDVLMSVGALELLFGIPEDQVELYFSGSKGFHILVQPESFGLVPVKNLEVYYKAIAVKINSLTIGGFIDTSIFDKKRLFRMPNTINSKTGLYKVPITIDELRKTDLTEMKQYASQQHQVDWPQKKMVQGALQKIVSNAENLVTATHRKSNPKSIVSFKKRPPLPCVQLLIEQGSKEGHRNNDCVAIASSLAQAGYSLDEATEIMASWNDNTEPPLPFSEVMRTVRSAYDIAKAGRGYGCNYFKRSGYCVGETCKLFKK